jgi:hypothetical protein
MNRVPYPEKDADLRERGINSSFHHYHNSNVCVQAPLNCSLAVDDERLVQSKAGQQNATGRGTPVASALVCLDKKTTGDGASVALIARSMLFNEHQEHQCKIEGL